MPCLMASPRAELQELEKVRRKLSLGQPSPVVFLSPASHGSTGLGIAPLLTSYENKTEGGRGGRFSEVVAEQTRGRQNEYTQADVSMY